MALVSAILPTVARRGGLDPIGLSALAAAPFVANLLGAFAGRFGPRNTAQLGARPRPRRRVAPACCSSCRRRRSSSRSRWSSGSASRSAARSTSACGARCTRPGSAAGSSASSGWAGPRPAPSPRSSGACSPTSSAASRRSRSPAIVGVACAIGYLGLRAAAAEQPRSYSARESIRALRDRPSPVADRRSPRASTAAA